MFQVKSFRNDFGKLINDFLRRLRFLASRNLQRQDLKTSFQNLHVGGNINSVLKTQTEVDACIASLRALRLHLRGDKPKNWDAYRSFSFILQNGNRDSKILDVGSRYGVLLPWLSLYGFTGLYGCDLGYEKDFYEDGIFYTKQNLERTGFDSHYFDFVSSLSVIEHGVDLSRYFAEMSRILKPKGFLLTSTDYWPDPIDTRGLYPYGKEFGEMKIFSRPEIERMILTAGEHGFRLCEDMDFSYREKVVHWKRLQRKFTFIFLAMRKDDAGI